MTTLKSTRQAATSPKPPANPPKVFQRGSQRTQTRISTTKMSCFGTLLV